MDADLKINFNCTRPELELEESRAKAINKVIRNVVLALIPLGLAVISYFAMGLTFHQNNLTAILIIVGVYAALAIYFVYKAINKVQAETKGFIMDSICSFLKINHSVKANGFPYLLFNHAGLLPGHDNKRINDHIYGTYKGIDFNLAECRLTKTRRYRNGKNTTRESEEVYHGIMVALKYPHSFAGETLISSDSGFFRNFFKGIQQHWT